MGSESSSFHNCQLQEELEVSTDKKWQLYRGNTHDGCDVSIFVYKPHENSELRENAAQVRLRILNLFKASV